MMKNVFNLNSPFIYLVTDRHCLKNKTLEQAVEQAILGGVKIVQLREKTGSSKQLFEQALMIKAICQHHDVPFLINDRLDIALAVDADGVHLGQSDLPVDIARRLLGCEKIIGVSARTVGQAIQAERQGADYLGVGAIFGTQTKDDAIKIELKVVQQIYQSVTLPLILIGGIQADNLLQLQKNLESLSVSPSGFAVVSALLAQDDIYQSSQFLSEKLSNHELYLKN